MRTILLAACLTLLAAEAQAESRYNTTSMSCARLQQTVRSDGAAILRWVSPTSGVQRYDRFVRDDSFCQVAFETKLTTVPAADTKSCRVYNCKPVQRFFDR
ncbi:hypothetical protein [Aminobacter sp. AP02]|uniref:hypothetical protein n=1 Tax=Aminobacter sp. AP02 TaxID=2135737 RepID=UPI000D6C23A0|nr:hypothetical protein [Aminobacter sp. AP02]PWK72637.1 hypothetical protein C8K44_10578 [Aminobacter sp. AP02]